ncbi:reverse transcriptase domain-containing protein [Tanacetum coccineum]
MCDPENYVLLVKINGVVEMVALVDTGASISVLPYSLYKDLGLDDSRPYQTNLTKADNTQAKAMGEVKNVRIQIGYQAYVVDLLILDISVDPELPLLLGRPFLRTCGDIIDMGRGMLCIDDGVIHHTYFPKPRSKAYVEAFEMKGEADMVASKERCQKRDLWMMSALEESRGVNLAWIITNHLYKHALGTKENSVICAGHYVTKIACFLGYCVDDEMCSESIDCEYWISKMLADELDVENTCLKKETEIPTQAEEGSREPRQEHGGLNTSWGD